MAYDKFKILKSTVVPMPIENVDTDQIIPARFLKATERKGFGDNLFRDWRYDSNNLPIKDFVLNNKNYSGKILVGGKNFGSGSSREHAAWAIYDYGFRCVISSFFADIFRNNCFQNGMLSIILDKKEVDYIMGMSLTTKNYQLNVDLENETIYDESGFKTGFKIDPFRRDSLLKGEDEIARTLTSSSYIDNFEKNRIKRW